MGAVDLHVLPTVPLQLSLGHVVGEGDRSVVLVELQGSAYHHSRLGLVSH